jgi:hypothetical protein
MYNLVLLDAGMLIFATSWSFDRPRQSGNASLSQLKAELGVWALLLCLISKAHIQARQARNPVHISVPCGWPVASRVEYYWDKARQRQRRGPRGQSSEH